MLGIDSFCSNVTGEYGYSCVAIMYDKYTVLPSRIKFPISHFLTCTYLVTKKISFSYLSRLVCKFLWREISSRISRYLVSFSHLASFLVFCPRLLNYNILLQSQLKKKMDFDSSFISKEIEIDINNDDSMIFFLARVHETWMKESFSVIDRYLLWEQCNYIKHLQMHLIDSVECFVL